MDTESIEIPTTISSSLYDDRHSANGVAPTYPPKQIDRGVWVLADSLGLLPRIPRKGYSDIAKSANLRTSSAPSIIPAGALLVLAFDDRVLGDLATTDAPPIHHYLDENTPTASRRSQGRQV
ncbi:hypothetical protein GCM10009020_33480 [Natronoarchaeum mannanilyticum]|uniref:Uncharacterized protein n=1 Tax=Natronoarchaeum mannanilyticum TaxID=926360 RepID=A0AAV3TEI1_9EURY